MNTAAIGIFDSGLGGLTVAREIAQQLPHESLVYVGDTARCPYGPRDASEVQRYVLEIGQFLQNQGVKLMVIACNTATSYGLELAQQTFDIPVIGVVYPGARAAVRATKARRVAVIGTRGTIYSAAYPKAIAALDAGIDVFSRATPEFVDIVEAGFDSSAATDVPTNGELRELAEGYLCPLVANGADVLVLGCTHYPVLAEALQAVVGPEVTLISSAAEVATEVKCTLMRRGHLAGDNRVPEYTFYTTDDDVATFKRHGSRAFGADLGEVHHLELDEETA